MKTHIENTIKTDCLSLAVDKSMTTTCPFCDGGTSHEKSFSITRECHGILYHCFRATCHAAGFIPAIAGTAVAAKRERQRHFTRPLSGLPIGVRRFLYEEYELGRQDVDMARWKYDYTRNRLYMPIITEQGWDAGAVSKALDGSKPKSLTYFWSPLYRLHVAPSEVDAGPIVVVEDQISAAKVARQARCVALLGTSMSPEVAQRLALLSTKVIVALDADTWSHSRSIGYNMKQKYGLLFENFSVVRLSNDPKAMTDKEIREVILSAMPE